MQSIFCCFLFTLLLIGPHWVSGGKSAAFTLFSAEAAVAKQADVKERSEAIASDFPRDRTLRDKTVKVSEKTIEEAQIQYEIGENTNDYWARLRAFNKALSLYSDLENQEDTDSSELQLSLGDSYFQLGVYPWAILHYERALKNDPSNTSAHTFLQAARSKLGLATPLRTKTPLEQFAAFSNKRDLLFWAIFALFASASLAIWIPARWIAKPSWRRAYRLGNGLICFFSLAILTAYGAAFYESPLEGILIQSEGLYRAPDFQQSKLANEPLMAGSKVVVLQMTEDKKWIKAMDSGGRIGFIPSSALRPI